MKGSRLKMVTEVKNFKTQVVGILFGFSIVLSLVSTKNSSNDI